MVELRFANWQEHKAVASLARQVGPHVSTFHDVRYIKDAYDNEHILVAAPTEQPTLLVGFCYFKHLTRHPHTSIYELGVLPDWRGAGIGASLLHAVLAMSPHDTARLVVDAGNEKGQEFWARHGFRAYRHGVNRRGERLVYMEAAWN